MFCTRSTKNQIVIIVMGNDKMKKHNRRLKSFYDPDEEMDMLKTTFQR